MADAIEEVQRIRDDEAGRRDDDEAEAAALTRQIDLCEQQMRDALELLERSEP